jgi:hypothetical protein
VVAEQVSLWVVILDAKPRPPSGGGPPGGSPGGQLDLVPHVGVRTAQPRWSGRQAVDRRAGAGYLAGWWPWNDRGAGGEVAVTVWLEWVERQPAGGFFLSSRLVV